MTRADKAREAGPRAPVEPTDDWETNPEGFRALPLRRQDDVRRLCRLARIGADSDRSIDHCCPTQVGVGVFESESESEWEECLASHRADPPSRHRVWADALLDCRDHVRPPDTRVAAGRPDSPKRQASPSRLPRSGQSLSWSESSGRSGRSGRSRTGEGRRAVGWHGIASDSSGPGTFGPAPATARRLLGKSRQVSRRTFHTPFSRPK
jgi:hypothetical protein